MQRILDALNQTPAVVLNGRLDVVASNSMFRALYADSYERSDSLNLARFNFLDPFSIGFYRDWNDASNTTVSLLRADAGRNPYDKDLTDLIGELSTRSDEFRTRWAAHDVRLHRTGEKHIKHPVVGELDMTFQTLEVSGEPGLSMTAYSAEPGTSSEDGLRLLASWSASKTSVRVE